MTEKQLSDQVEKSRVKISKVNAGVGAYTRLASMGLLPGIEIEVIRNQRRGPLIIAIDGNKLMLGRNMAQKIIVLT